MLIAAVAAANRKTIVVLETGGPVLMPWLDRTSTVVEAWYPGIKGGEAIAATLFGDRNPSGRLPATFPATLAQLPRPALPYAGDGDAAFAKADAAGRRFPIDYAIEGADVGYRWQARRRQVPLFPFGFGLSYTSFAHGVPSLTGGATPVASVTVRNTGTRAGSDVAQLYLVATPAGRTLRLTGFAKATLAPGATQTLAITAEPRVVADHRDGNWVIARGRYGFAVGRSATDLGPITYVELPAARWR